RWIPWRGTGHAAWRRRPSWVCAEGFVNPAFRPGFHSAVVVGPAFRGGFGHVHPFGSSVFISPFFGFGFPFYPYAPVVPFYSQPIYSAPTYITPDQTVTNSYQSTDDLRNQVQQLTNEVQQLQGELAARGGQAAPTAAPEQKPPSITLILKDGRRIDAPGYA